ncbi:MAG: phage portal protein [Faecousia sp.]
MRRRYEDVIHVKTSHSLNGLVSLSVQDILRETVQGAKSGQEYMNKLYEQGMTAKATLEYTGTLSPEAKEALREAFEDFGAGVKNTGRIMPVPLGMKLTPLDIKLTDAQFFELRKYTALQIAGAFGVKPNQINDYEKSSYSNSEMQQLSFLTETMLFILKQYEEEVGYKVLGEEVLEGGEYVKINEKALLRTDSKTQMEVMTGYTKNGIYLINESRAYLDMEGVEYGDRPLVNGTMIPLDVAANKTGTATISQQPMAPSDQEDEGEEPEEDQEGGEEDEESED